MTTRAHNPDTDADVRLRQLLSDGAGRHFVMVAGAGSGKTTSLVKALDYVQKAYQPKLRRRGQRVACITYTEGAAAEIWGDVGNDPLFHVSTIHSFLWNLVKPFQQNIKTWTAARIDERLAALCEERDNLGPRVRQKRRDRIAADIARYQKQGTFIGDVSRFTYGTGSDYPKGILGHDDIIRMVPALLEQYELFRRTTAERFPFIFVDESQDTAPVVVSALKLIAATVHKEFTLGFFGDPMQKIYMSGIGPIALEDNWHKIEKPENFRCPTRVLSVINKIREDGDGLAQNRGRAKTVDGRVVPVEGTARLFILPSDGHRTERLQGVRQWLAEKNNDEQWQSDERSADVKMLVLVHRMAAHRLGFSELYSALNDNASTAISEGFADGTHWTVRLFLQYILPIVDARATGRDFEALSLLRSHSPRLTPTRIQERQLSETLDSLKESLTALGAMLAPKSKATILDVLTLAQAAELCEVDERLAAYVRDFGETTTKEAPGADEDEDTAAEYATIEKYFSCPANQMRGYRTYIDDQSPFSTQQGIKGREFYRVLTLIDDEARHFQFSYNKYFRITPLSETDFQHIAAKEETVVDRTRRLFYVCCSRAVQDLAVVLFTNDVGLAEHNLRAAGFFPPEDIHVLATPK